MKNYIVKIILCILAVLLLIKPLIKRIMQIIITDDYIFSSLISGQIVMISLIIVFGFIIMKKIDDQSK